MIYDGTNIPTVTSTVINNLVAGDQYMYRVTGINRVGEGNKSPYSAVIMAASVPSRPDQPIFLSATSTTITIQINAVIENGGTAVTSYILYANSPTQAGSAFTPVLSYDGSSLKSFTI